MGRFKEIYATTQWKRIRKAAIRRDSGLCQDCKKRNIIRAFKEVHHIIELSEENRGDWNIVYNINNLICLCSDCHNHRHQRSIGLQDFITPP